jgi:8-oxo-dGTP pyrophosphatase MutT (NUDIX family)
MALPANGAPAQLSSRVVYVNRWMVVREDELRLPDGSTGIYGYVDKPDFAVVIPLQDDGFHLVEQFRYPIGRRSLEFPQGSYPDRRTTGDPVALARQELVEETGLRAERIEYLGRLANAAGLATQGFHVLLATGLVAGTPDREIEEADMTQRWLSIASFEEHIAAGEIVDAPTIAAYSLLRLRLSGRGGTGGS